MSTEWEQRGTYWITETADRQYLVEHGRDGWTKKMRMFGDTRWDLISTHPTAEEAMNG